MSALRVTEAQWQRTVIEAARAFGWRCAHFRPAQTEQGWRTPVEADGAGWPDLVMVRGPRLIFAELKSDKGTASPEQVAWLDALRGVEEAVSYCVGTTDGESLLDPNLSHEADYHGTAVEVWLWRPADWPFVEETLR